MDNLALVKNRKCSVRIMSENEALDFTNLLYSVYGNTYTYKNLYSPENYVELIHRKDTICYGFFDEQNELIGHSAIRYDKNYCYSFLSMKKWTKKYPVRFFEKTNWEIILNELSLRAIFLFQNTTTSHLLAQKYSAFYMKSNPIGFIFNYTKNEYYKSIKTNNNRVHFLTQVSQLNKIEEKRVRLFKNEWTKWIKICYSGLGFMLQTCYETEEDKKEGNIEITYDDQALDLIEYSVSGSLPEISFPTIRKKTLVKIPIDDLLLFEKLNRLSFIPVGIRPNIYKCDELVLQYLTKKEIEIILKNLELTSLYSMKAKKMLKFWADLAKKAF